jgi:hypothetical protein
MKPRTTLPLLLCAALAACSSEESPPDDATAEMSDPGDGEVGADDGKPAEESPMVCDAALARYAAPVELSAVKDRFTSSEQYIGLYARLDGSEHPDQLRLVSFERFGFVPGTYPLPSREWAVNLCTDLGSSMAGGCAADLEVLAGTLTLTSVDGRMSGSLSGVELADDRGTPTCAASIADFSFDVALD